MLDRATLDKMADVIEAEIEEGKNFALFIISPTNSSGALIQYVSSLDPDHLVDVLKQFIKMRNS